MPPKKAETPKKMCDNIYCDKEKHAGRHNQNLRCEEENDEGIRCNLTVDHENDCVFYETDNEGSCLFCYLLYHDCRKQMRGNKRRQAVFEGRRS